MPTRLLISFKIITEQQVVLIFCHDAFTMEGYGIFKG